MTIVRTKVIQLSFFDATPYTPIQRARAFYGLLSVCIAHKERTSQCVLGPTVLTVGPGVIFVMLCLAEPDRYLIFESIPILPITKDGTDNQELLVITSLKHIFKALI